MIQQSIFALADTLTVLTFVYSDTNEGATIGA